MKNYTQMALEIGSMWDKASPYKREQIMNEVFTLLMPLPSENALLQHFMNEVINRMENADLQCFHFVWECFALRGCISELTLYWRAIELTHEIFIKHTT